MKSSLDEITLWLFHPLVMGIKEIQILKKIIKVGFRTGSTKDHYASSLWSLVPTSFFKGKHK